MPTTDLTWSLPADLDARCARACRCCASRTSCGASGIGDAVGLVGRRRRPLARLADAADAGSRRPSTRVVRFADEMKAEGMSDVVLLGMGGSSLAPEVIHSIIGRADGLSEPPRARLHRSRRRFSRSNARSISSRTLFLVASKSGSTLEVNILKQYFFHRAVQKFGEAEAGRRFVLTTDPGSKLQQIAEQEHFREIFRGRAERRRPLLGALELRARAGRADRRRRLDAARSRRGDGAPLRVRRRRQRGVRAGRRARRAGARRAATSRR